MQLVRNKFKVSLGYSCFKVHFHKQYNHVSVSTGAATLSMASQCDCYCESINADLPKDKHLDHSIELPNMVPEYKKHVLLVSPKDEGYAPEWRTSWQSKLELNPKWPYSSIGILKDHLKHSVEGSGILVNALSMVSGSITSPEREDRRLHFYVIPDMKLYKITEHQIEGFAHFLGGGKSTSLNFNDFLKGADNANIESAETNPESSNETPKFEYENVIRDWVLICGHQQRDPRCGIICEDLLKEIKLKSLCEDRNIGIISHIGGHKYAGNIILYNHAGFSDNSKGYRVDSLWFGRVLPPNLEMLLQSIDGYKIPRQFYRGGLQMN